MKIKNPFRSRDRQAAATGTSQEGGDKVPFFARFLEEQELSQVIGGRTLKFPSDGDDDDF